MSNFGANIFLKLMHTKVFKKLWKMYTVKELCMDFKIFGAAKEAFVLIQYATNLLKYLCM